jgi:hypothetical protein
MSYKPQRSELHIERESHLMFLETQGLSASDLGFLILIQEMEGLQELRYLGSYTVRY